MELRHLRYFVAVAEELSFTKAAKRLHMAQPPLSQQVRALEDELGFRLFNRESRQIELTRDGREFLGEARAILEQMTELQQRAALRARGALGSLKVGVYPSFMSNRFAQAIQAYLQANPGWKITVRDRSSFWQVEALRQGRLDVGFVTNTAELGDDLDVYPLKKMAMRLAVPSSHGLASRSQVTWADLAGEAFVMIDPEIITPGYYAEFRQRCQRAGFDPVPSHFALNAATQLWFVAAGLGIAPMAVIPEDEPRPGVTYVTLPKDAPTYQTAMIWRRVETTGDLKKFTDFLRQRLK